MSGKDKFGGDSMNLKPELKCQIVPIDLGYLLIPENLLVEVTKFNGGATDDSVLWRNREVPLFKGNGEMDIQDGDKSSARIAILRTVLGEESLPFIAIKVSGIPHSIYVSDKLMEDEGNTEVGFLSACSVRIGSLMCLIPDLPKIEKSILNQSFHEEMAL